MRYVSYSHLWTDSSSWHHVCFECSRNHEMRIEQTTEEKAAHFASIGMMDRANYYATIVLINEIKELRKTIDERLSARI